MKKQILILTFFVAAMVAGMNSYGQAPNLGGAATCLTPTAPNATCLSADHLHPVPGTDYTYEITIPTPAGTKEYTWLVTQDQSFITAGAISATAEANDGSGAHIFSTGTGYNDPTSGAATITIQWKSFTHDAANPVFLMIYADNDNGVCTTDNMEVFIIEPVHAFTLDIENLSIDGSSQAADYETCVAPVLSATYNAGTVEFDYGTNYIFFQVNAANFSQSWQPSFQVGGAALAGSRVVSAVDWAYPGEAVSGTWHTMSTTDNVSWTTASENVAAQAATTVGATGECIVVRVEVDNNQAESIVAAAVTLAVDGVMQHPVSGVYTDRAYADVHHADCSDDNFTNDVAQQILTPRPDINEVTPTAPSFVGTDRD